MPEGPVAISIVLDFLFAEDAFSLTWNRIWDNMMMQGKYFGLPVRPYLSRPIVGKKQMALTPIFLRILRKLTCVGRSEERRVGTACCPTRSSAACSYNVQDAH